MSDNDFKEAWPEKPIEEYENINDGRWGYLIHENGQFNFDTSERPSDDEIMARWGKHFTP
jgi:hypothetical protein